MRRAARMSSSTRTRAAAARFLAETRRLVRVPAPAALAVLLGLGAAASCGIVAGIEDLRLTTGGIDASASPPPSGSPSRDAASGPNGPPPGSPDAALGTGGDDAAPGNGVV